MGNGLSVRKLLWTLGVGLAATSLLGLECQFEPLPDERRGYEGDLCKSNGTCESCTPLPDGTCGRLICAMETPPRCRRECPLGADPATCGTCGPEARCEPVRLADGGFSTGVGACSVAPSEGEPCPLDSCAGCLECATDPATLVKTCRRVCDPSRDPGPPGTGVVVPHSEHAWCGYADDWQANNALVLANCCLFGQTCAAPVPDSDGKSPCFGPMPGQVGSTCRRLAGQEVGGCDSNARCQVGNPDASVPNHCVAAGGLDQPCRINNTCDPGLTCIADAKFGDWPICRRNCDTTPTACAFCATGLDGGAVVAACVPVIGAAVGVGVCIPAVTENTSCTNGEFCSGCLVCGGVAGPTPNNKCRRGCFPGADAGTTAGPPPANCNAPDNTPVMGNCCLPGDICRAFTDADGGLSGGAACYEP
ncbi:MAG: hypothetical protein HY904_02430 [Deltaproteobacteria bacterium]|nr:hypothetical protein [Deltaproteobacteria bacterium]